MWDAFLDRASQSSTVVHQSESRGFFKRKNDLLSVEYVNYIHKDTLSYLDHYPMKNPKPETKKLPNAQKGTRNDERKPAKPVPVYFRVPVEATGQKRSGTVPKCKGSEECKCGPKCHKSKDLEKLRKNIASLLTKPQAVVPKTELTKAQDPSLKPILIAKENAPDAKIGHQKSLEINEKTFITSQPMLLEECHSKRKVEILEAASLKNSVQKKGGSSDKGLGDLLKKYLYYKGVGIGVHYKLFKVTKG